MTLTYLLSEVLNNGEPSREPRCVSQHESRYQLARLPSAGALARLIWFQSGHDVITALLAVPLNVHATCIDNLSPRGGLVD
jgi:hypothetical protein